MNYEYINTNLLENPHKYMYSTFSGYDFLCGYAESRALNLADSQSSKGWHNSKDYFLARQTYLFIDDQLKLFSENSQQFFRKLMGNSIYISDFLSPEDGLRIETLSKSLGIFAVDKITETSILLEALIASILYGGVNDGVKLWVGRLVQRFEVSKKIYERYLPGFRKPEGSSDDVRLYWLLALALATYHIASRDLQSLSTLLKVSDLLCSLPRDLTRETLPKHGMPIVISAELASVAYICTQQKVYFDIK